MTPSARLRELALAATPGPWGVGLEERDAEYFSDFTPVFVHDLAHDVALNLLLAFNDADARLAALAPELAAWAADAMEALEFYARPGTYEESAEPHPTKFATGLIPIEQDSGRWARALLARLDGLLPEGGE